MEENQTYQQLRRKLDRNFTIIKEYEKIRIKLIKATNRRAFLLRCRSNKIIPNFIDRWNHRGVEEVWHRRDYMKALHIFKVSVLNSVIADSIATINMTNNRRNQLERRIHTLRSDSFEPVSYFSYVDKKVNNIHNKIKDKLINKYHRLMANNKPRIKIRETWIKNISNTNLPEDVELCLGLGPGFNFKKDQIDKNDIFNIIKNTEVRLKNDDTEAQNIREDICRVTNTAIKNYSKQYTHVDMYLKTMSKTTGRFIREHPEITITTADKGNVTVVQNTTDYTTKAKEQLNDQNVYGKLRTNPTNKLLKQNNDIVKQWHEHGHIDKNNKDRLTLSTTVPPKIYFLPKIHKENVPYRPVVSSIDSPTYGMSKWLSAILARIVGKNDSHVRNSFEFVSKIKGQKIPEDHILLSLDVTSLYTNIPVDLAIKIVEKRWEDIEPHTGLNKTSFLEGIKFCLTNTYFVFQEGFYQQKQGVAMGSPISSVVANLVMEDLEKTCLNMLGEKPAFYFRYVDDLVLTYNKNNLDHLLEVFHTYHPSLRFTIELEENKSIPFLDTKIIRTEENSVITDWYQKPTHSWRYIHFLSNHPRSQKVNVLNNVIDRALKLAHPELRQKNLQLVKNAFQDNGYPLNIIKTCIQNRVHILYNTGHNKTTELNNKPYVTIPYINRNSLGYQKMFKKYGYNTAFSTNNRNKKHFSKLKTAEPVMNVSNIVYSIPCSDCQKIYVGNTSQQLKKRLTQHKSDTRLKPNSTGLAIHANAESHVFDYNNTTILDRETQCHKRNISEMLHIQATLDTNVNKRTDTQSLNNIYKKMINRLPH